MKLKRASLSQGTDVELALHMLRECRKLLLRAGCANSAERVRLAITSTDGARRHIERRITATLKGNS